MSFGFSAGDFIAAIKLCKDIAKALRGKSTAEYRELMLEVHGLERALNEIEHLPTTPETESHINAVKAASLLCRYPLQEFQQKLTHYSALDSFALARGRDGLPRAAKKVQWNLDMASDAMKLRAYIVAHVGSLNMRLQTLGIRIALASASKHQAEASASVAIIDQLSDQVDRNNKGIFGLHTLVVDTIVPQLQALLEMAGRIWASNMQIMERLRAANDGASRIDLDHSWFQTPLRFEDALGRMLPIPSEYNWAQIGAIIKHQFTGAPGQDKVLSGDYELLNISDPTYNPVIPESAILPGVKIKMCFVIGLYQRNETSVCPRPGCGGKEFESRARPVVYSGLTCKQCQVWFRESSKRLVRPMRAWELSESDFGAAAQEGREAAPQHLHARRQVDLKMQRVLHRIREERKAFRNVLLDRTVSPDALLYDRVQSNVPSISFSLSACRGILASGITAAGGVNIETLSAGATWQEMGLSRANTPALNRFMNKVHHILTKFDIQRHGTKNDMLFHLYDLLNAGSGEPLLRSACGENFEHIREQTKMLSDHDLHRADVWPKLKHLCADEMGLSEEELPESESLYLVDLGLESLLTVALIQRIRDEFGVELLYREIQDETLLTLRDLIAYRML